MLALFLCVSLAQAPQQPPRDNRPREGTAVISGLVTAADSSLPLRRAQVMLMGAPPITRDRSGQVPPGAMSGNRSVLTDHEGRFEFTGLPGGSYRIRVMPGSFRGQYLSAAYGANGPRDRGKAIELKDGQRFEQANVALPRGAAITGRVIDEFGEPVSRVSVYAARVMAGGASYARMGGGLIQSDDLGRFRVYGLEPGEYILAAESRGGMGGPPVEGETEGFATTYYPSALNEREAARVRVSAGADTGEMQIQLVRTRTFTITGMVMDSRGRPIARPNAMLMRRSVGGAGMSGSGVSFEPGGRFTIRNVVPGEYRFVVRPQGMGGPPPPPGTQGDKPVPSEYASVPLTINSDIQDVVVVTRPGGTVSGDIVFAEGPPLTPPSGLRVMTTPGDRMMFMGAPSNGEVGTNMQFVLKDVFGPVYIRIGGVPRGYALKEVRLGREEITDVPVEFSGQHKEQLRVVLTNRVGTVEGTVTDDDGAVPADFVVMAIPEEQSAWRMGSPRLRMSGMPQDGKFSIQGLLPGRYYVLALPRERMAFGPEPAPEFFEQLTKEATPVVLNDGETRTVELRLSEGAER
jgi:hypothetical protein